MRKKSAVILISIIVMLVSTTILFVQIFYSNGKPNQQIKNEIEQKSGRKISALSRISHMYYQALKVGDSKDFVHKIILSYSSLRSGPITIKDLNYEFEEYRFDEDFTYHIIIIYDCKGRIYSIELT